MGARYSAFTFCDRITEYEPARHARAQFAIPPGIGEFSSCLVAEATGQLAAWVSMAHIGFRGRPVAALAGETRFAGDVAPGQLLDLVVDIEHCDDDAVAYAGRASVGGHTVLELVDCVGPMLPQEDYDAPEDVARQFELLRGPGAAPGRFPGIERPPLNTLEQVSGKSRRARLDVPDDAPYFADHFPRRAVFPATLLLDSAIRVARDLAREQPQGGSLRPSRVTHVKMRDFTLPGQSVDIAAEALAPGQAAARIGLTMKVGERTVATARVEFAPVRDATR